MAPRTIDLFPAHNDVSPVSGDVVSYDPTVRERIMVQSGKRQQWAFQCFRGPGCTACSRSPVLRAAMDQAKIHKADGLLDGTMKEAVAGLVSSGDKAAPITSYRAVDPLPEGIDANGNAEVLLVVMSGPNHVESETWVATTLRQMGWKGYIVFEVAVRCGTGDATDRHIEACAPYLVNTLRLTKAKRVLVCSTPASKAMIGNTMHPWNYGSWTHVRAPDNEDGTPDHERILVVAAPDPAEAWRNKFIARFFRAAIIRATQQEVPPGLPKVVGRVVETLSDFKAFKAWVPTVPWLSYDVEWTGIPHNNDFNFVCCAFSHPDHPVVWIFHDVLGVDEVYHYLKEMLQTKPIVAQNVAAEFVATQQFFKVELGIIEGDTMLAYKLLNVDSKAALEDLAYYIGYNSHKAEMGAEMDKHKAAAQTKVSTLVGGASHKAYIMDLIDPEILLRYNALDTHITGELHTESIRRLQKKGSEFLYTTYREFTLPATRLLHRIHCNGMGVDKKVAELSREALRREVKLIEDKLKANHMDSPSQLAAVRDHLIEHGMFDRLVQDHGHNETKMARFMSGKDNTLSTDKYTLKAMKDYGDVPKLLLEWREMMKLCASYGDTLVTYIRSDDRVHPSYRLDGARTGRLSVNSPNTTQIPKHGAHSSYIKNCFAARLGYGLVAFDYKTLEVFVAAIISGDEIMQEACRSADFHLETAKKMAPYAWHCTAEDVEHEVLVKKDKTKRTAAKGITFSVLYGAGPHSLADTLNCSLEQAQMLMSSYAKAYPTFAQWVRMTHAFAQENGYVHIPWNGAPARIRPLVGAGFQRFGGDGARFSQAMRQSQNSPPQGMAAQYAIVASMDLEEQFRKERMDAKVIAMVHDSIIVETHRSLVDEVIPRMYHAMTSLPTGCDLRLQVDAEVGETWGTLEHVDLKPYVGVES
jgi:DNA polymerase I-like protein with 3'-5' exonuclease and polymerase domains